LCWSPPSLPEADADITTRIFDVNVAIDFNVVRKVGSFAELCLCVGDLAGDVLSGKPVDPGSLGNEELWLGEFGHDGLLVAFRREMCRTMTDTVAKIRALLSELDEQIKGDEQIAAMRAFSGLELPDIIRDVVDLLMPELRPFEAAIYMHLLRHSIIETGTPYIRVSRRGLQNGVIKSAYTGSTSGGKDADSAIASYKTVQETLAGLEALGALCQEGEPNRDGTLYRVRLPEEIEVCQRRRKDVEARIVAVPADGHEADFYNVRENRLKIYERDGYKCQYCSKQLTRFTATLDHVKAVKDGGDNSFENLLTACLPCNSKKNSRLLGDFVADANPT